MGVTYICYDNSDKEDYKTNSDSDDLTVMKPPFLPFLFCFLVNAGTLENNYNCRR